MSTHTAAWQAYPLPDTSKTANVWAIKPLENSSEMYLLCSCCEIHRHCDHTTVCVLGRTYGKQRTNSKTATMDNGTMVESLKFLNYCQLAKNSLTSKRFRDLILMHRHKLALLHVYSIHMSFLTCFDKIFKRIFGKDLSPEEYNEWIVRNGYSKQIPLECQAAEMENTEDFREVYELTCRYKVRPKFLCKSSYATALYANAELNHENWPLFEHFIRLLTDPFIYIQSMELRARNEILHLLEKAMNPDRNRLQCERLCVSKTVCLKDNTPKFISWIKNHVRCDRLNVGGYCDSNCDVFRIYGDSDLNELNSELLDFFMTGANCTSDVFFTWRNSFPKIIGDFVQKFLDLKEFDEYRVVKSIAVNVHCGSTNELKEKYAEFIVKEEPSSRGTKYTFEIVNGNIRKKLQLTTDFKLGYYLSCCVLNL